MNMKPRLSTLWLFATLNFIYCDVVGLMNPSMLKGFIAGNVSGINVTPGFLLAGSVLVEIPMVMVLLSRLLPHRSNRVANLVAATVMTLVQLLSNFLGVPAPYYVFFSVIEIASTLAIIWFAWRWHLDESELPGQTEATRRVTTAVSPGQLKSLA